MHILEARKEALQTTLVNLMDSAKTAELRGMQGNLDINTLTCELIQTLAHLCTNLEDPQKIVPTLKELTESQHKLFLLPSRWQKEQTQH